MERQKRRRESGGVGSNSLPDRVALAVIATMYRPRTGSDPSVG
jgi:hypothetical protein